MKRLFLASAGLDYIKTFIDDEPSNLRMLFIPTAGNLDDDIWWIDKDREVLHDMGFAITEMDIEVTGQSDMMKQLEKTDIVYIAGGNTFHLLKQLRLSGFDDLLTRYINNGGLYAGASAGALIAGLDIAPVATIDEPEKVTGLESTKALGLVNFVPIPHYDMSGRTEPINAIKEEYGDQYELVLLTDDQAIAVKDDTWTVVESKRNPVEMDWYERSL